MMRSLSKAGHEKSCLNMGRPRSKPKYSLSTDSEQVQWWKGEKHPDEGSERAPETECLQAVGAPLPSGWQFGSPKSYEACDTMPMCVFCKTRSPFVRPKRKFRERRWTREPVLRSQIWELCTVGMDYRIKLKHHKNAQPRSSS